MKRLVLAVLGVGVLVGAGFYLNRPQDLPVSPAEPVTEPISTPASELPLTPEPALAAHTPSNPISSQTVQARNIPDQPVAPTKNNLDATMLNHAVDILVSPQATYGQRQAAWKQLGDAGKLDHAISQLEQRMAGEPTVAEYPAALGQAYLNKCATLKDVREQGILGMQADKAFDSALSLDPSNWEARFTKAVALSYWPAMMNKGNEVIEHFQTLIQQQEAQAPQPQFAESYVWLGDQYQKTGHSEYARTVWERGSSLFPNHSVLRTKLTSVNTAQNPNLASGGRVGNN